MTDATGVDDKSFNAIAWRGILEFYGDSWTNTVGRWSYYDWVTAPNQAMFEPNLLQATDEGYDLIVTTGFNWANPISRVAGNHPTQNYLLVDVGWVDLPNVMRAVYAEHEGSYLVGAAGAYGAWGTSGGVTAAAPAQRRGQQMQGGSNGIKNRYMERG